MFPSEKPYTLAGFERGSSEHQADAMTTAPRRQGTVSEILFKAAHHLNLKKSRPLET
jgi:hypothetical protein